MIQTGEHQTDMGDAALEMLEATSQSVSYTPLDELSSRRIQGSIVEQYARERRSRRLKRNAGMGLLIAALLVMGITAFRGNRADVDDRVASPPPLPEAKPLVVENSVSFIPGSRVVQVEGDAFVDAEHVEERSQIPIARQISTRDGELAFSLPTGIAVGVSADTQMRVIWGGNSHYGVVLTSGMALFSIDPDKQREAFFVDTPTGTFHVHGTLFTVVVSPENEVFIQLHLGKVDWVPKNGTPVSLPAGALFKTASDVASVDTNETVAAGIAHQLNEYKSRRDDTVFTEVSRMAAPPLSHASAPRRIQSESVSVSSSLKELMALAKHYKSQAQWSKAAGVYRKIIQMYPSSPEADTSRLSLGQLLLKKLNQPRAAIEQFAAYRRGPGPLQQEALYGKAKAYQALGDTTNEQRAWVELQTQFPNGLYARAALQAMEAMKRKSQ